MFVVEVFYQILVYNKKLLLKYTDIQKLKVNKNKIGYM